MQDTIVYINDEVVDLADDSPVLLTFQINTLADVKNQNSNTSKQFKLPLTQRNRRILGFPDDIRITNELPYTQYKAKIVQDGIEILPVALAELSDCDDNQANITIISGNVDFFDQIDAPIYDMGDSTKATGKDKPFAPYNHTWNLANTVAYRKATSGVVYPVIDYGQGLSGIAPVIVDVRALRPAFFLKTMIDLIVKPTGYKALGSMLSDPLYNKIIIPFANDQFEHGTDYQTQPDNLGLIATNNLDQTVTHIPIYDADGELHFPNITSDPKGQFDGTRFTAQQIFTGTILLDVPRFYFKGRRNDSNPSTVDIIINYDAIGGGNLHEVLTYDLTDFTRVPGTSGSGLQGYWEFGDRKVSTEIDFQVGDSITIRYQFKGDRPASFNMYAGATLTIKAKNENVLFGQDIQIERIFPAISQKDLLKDTLQRFAIICQTDNSNRTVTFASFKDIVRNIPVAKDWTLKCKNAGKNNSFHLGEYAKVNNMLYKKDDAITDGYADDIITVDDKTLPATYDLIQSQFAPSYNSTYFAKSTAQITKISIDADPGDFHFTESTEPRVLIDEKLNLADTTTFANITFTDGVNNIVVNDQVTIPYFHKIGGQFSLMWKDADGQAGLRSLYYKELERILTRVKKVIRYFILTPRDIVELDLLVPVYLEQDNAYFYISKIDSWQKGKPVKVELVKIGEVL